MEHPFYKSEMSPLRGCHSSGGSGPPALTRWATEIAPLRGAGRNVFVALRFAAPGFPPRSSWLRRSGPRWRRPWLTSGRNRRIDLDQKRFELAGEGAIRRARAAQTVQHRDGIEVVPINRQVLHQVLADAVQPLLLRRCEGTARRETGEGPFHALRGRRERLLPLCRAPRRSG